MAAVAPSAVPNARHSPRKANQSTPMNGVTLVSAMNAHRAGHRKPNTTTAAMSRWTFPAVSSRIVNGNRSRIHQRAGRIATVAPASSAVQRATNTGQATHPKGTMASPIAGEYRKAPTPVMPSQPSAYMAAGSMPQ